MGYLTLYGRHYQTSMELRAKFLNPYSPTWTRLPSHTSLASYHCWTGKMSWAFGPWIWIQSKTSKWQLVKISLKHVPWPQTQKEFLQINLWPWNMYNSVSSKPLWRNFDAVTCLFDALQCGCWNLKRGFLTCSPKVSNTNPPQRTCCVLFTMALLLLSKSNRSILVILTQSKTS